MFRPGAYSQKDRLTFSPLKCDEILLAQFMESLRSPSAAPVFLECVSNYFRELRIVLEL